MLYPYVTLGDGTEVLHSQIIKEDGVEKVEVQFERPIENGFKSARCILPTYEWINIDNYSKEEIEFLTQLVESNAHLFYEFARSGGIANCQVS